LERPGGNSINQGPTSSPCKEPIKRKLAASKRKKVLGMRGVREKTDRETSPVTKEGKSIRGGGERIGLFSGGTEKGDRIRKNKSRLDFKEGFRNIGERGGRKGIRRW